MLEKNRYFLLNKPFNMVSQFKSTHPVQLLTALNFNFPEGTHAIGRLDNESEGLLLLTTDKRVTKLLFESSNQHKRVYKVLVLHKVSLDTVEKLRNGVEFVARGGGNYTTKPCEVNIISEPNFNFPSPYFKSEFQQYTWLEFILTEGKYRQIRKMCAAVGHRCKRLVRTSIEDLSIDNIGVGAIKEIDEKSFYEGLRI